MKEFLDLISPYWSQIVIVLFAFGYIVKVVFESKIRKSEIQYNTLHIQRFEALKNFYRDFIQMQMKLNDYFIYSKYKRTDKANETFIEISNDWAKFYESFTFLRLFFDEKYSPKFENLYYVLLELQQEIDNYNQLILSGKLTDNEIQVKYKILAETLIGEKLFNSIRDIDNVVRKNFGVKRLKR